jgi:polar amino acid transport system substrate-binding protein
MIMKRNNYRFITCMFAWFLYGVTPQAESTESAAGATQIRTASQENTEPKYVTIKKDGKTIIDGLCIDVLRAIERVDPSLKFVGDQNIEPMIRTEFGVASGSIDLTCGLLRSKEREAKFRYIEPELFSVYYYLAVREDDDVQINNWDDIRKLGDQGVILVMNGFGMIKKMEALGGLKIDSGAKDSKTNIDKLLSGRGRFYLHRTPGFREEIIKSGAQGKVKLLPVQIHSEKTYMVVSKQLPENIVEKIHKAIVQIKNSGEMQKMQDKWNWNK